MTTLGLIVTIIEMVSFIKVLVIFVAINLVQSGNIISDTESNPAFLSELSLLFDIDDHSKNLVDDKTNVCDTKECKIIANEFLRGMNKSVDPCDNFYDYVCGGWETQNFIPDYEPMWSRFHIFQDTVNRRVKAILETEPLSTDILPVRQAKKWYQSCMDIGTLEKRGIKPLEAVLIQVGGWPMTLDPEEWNENEHSWKSVEHDYFHITGDYVFYDVSLSWEDEFAISFEAGSIPLYQKLPKEYRNYTGDDYETYVELITEVIQLFVDYNKAAVTKEMIEKDVHDLVEFEKELYWLDKSVGYEYDNSTLAEFVQWYEANITELELTDDIQKIDFGNLIRRKFELVNREIEDSDTVFVDNRQYYVQLTKILNETPTRTIVNYIHWHFVSDMLIYTTEAARDAFFMIMRNEYDVKKRAPRWLECIGEMKMETAAGYAFVKKYFSPEVEATAREMIENVRQESATQIDESNWMDEETKRVAKEKLAAMEVMLGFPDWYRNETHVLNSFKGLTIGFDHFDNILSFRKYKIKQRLRNYGRKWYMDQSADIDPTIVNAYYDPFGNDIILPAANFQPPLFTSRFPSTVNYGMMGLAVGHEIGHGFDNYGIKLGSDGNDTTISTEMLDIYDEQAECFVEQFNEYLGDIDDPESERMSRGQLTRPDNIADSTGLQSVYKAFKKLSAKESNVNYKLPGFENFSDDQMFYISFATMWCEAVTPKYAEKRLKYDSHSPGRFRVIGPASNTEKFAEAFNCPIGSPMNPERKCNVWQSPLSSDTTEKSAEFKRRRRLGWIRKG